MCEKKEKRQKIINVKKEDEEKNRIRLFSPLIVEVLRSIQYVFLNQFRERMEWVKFVSFLLPLHTTSTQIMKLRQHRYVWD